MSVFEILAVFSVEWCMSFPPVFVLLTLPFHRFGTGSSSHILAAWFPTGTFCFTYDLVSFAVSPCTCTCAWHLKPAWIRLFSRPFPAAADGVVDGPVIEKTGWGQGPWGMAGVQFRCDSLGSEGSRMLVGAPSRRRRKRHGVSTDALAAAVVAITLALATMVAVLHAWLPPTGVEVDPTPVPVALAQSNGLKELVRMHRFMDRGDKNQTMQDWIKLCQDNVKGPQDVSSRREAREKLLPRLQERLKQFQTNERSRNSRSKRQEGGREELARLLNDVLDDIFFADQVADCPHDPSLPTDAYSGKKIFIASNLHENEPLMPHYVYMLVLTILNFESFEDVYLSIYESGSVDKTAQWLAFLRVLLDSIGVKNVIMSGPDQRKAEQNRIDFLASCRNRILEPFFSQTKKGVKYDKLVLINDVYFCRDHITRLVLHNTDMACGLDVTRTPPSEHLLFYDVWVARDATGHMFSNFPPYVEHSYSRMRIEFGMPFPVHCCWNGLAVLSPAPFLESGVRFRSHNPDECAASECSLICRDFYMNGYREVVVDPAVRVAYAREDQDVAYDLLVNVPYKSWHEIQGWGIDWDHVPRKTHVLCCPLPEERDEVEFDPNPWAVVRQDCFTEHLD